MKMIKELYFTLLLFLLTLISSNADLVAHWPLDIDAKDATGNGHDGQIINGTVLFENAGASDLTGNAASFPDNGRIDIPFNPDLNPESFTITLWAKATSTNGYASPITGRNDVNGGQSTHGYIIYNDASGNWNFWTGDGDPGWDTLYGGPVTTNQWTHLAISYDSETETKTIWINGTEKGSESAPNQYSPNGTVGAMDLHLGAGQDDGANFFFSGDIDDVGLWDEALTEEDIKNIMQNGISSTLVDPRINAPLKFIAELATSDSFAIKVSNRGETRDLIIDSVEIVGADSSNFTINAIPAPIEPGEENLIEIKFDSKGETGTFESQLEIYSNDPNRELLTVAILATVHDPILNIERDFNFGVFSSGSGPQSANIQIKNDGASRELNLLKASIIGKDVDNFSVVNFPSSLAAGSEAENISLNFNPKQDAGRFSAQIEIVSNDALSEIIIVNLSAEVEITDPLVAWWPLDEDASDNSGNGFDGIVQGTINFGQTGANESTGGAGLFDGSSHIDVPWNPQLNTENFSVTLWVNPSAAGGSYRSPITNRDDVAPVGAFRHGWIIYNNPNSQWSFWNGGGRGSDGAWNGMNVGPVEIDEWHHLAITYDSASNTKVFYIDGSEVSTSNPISFSPNNSELNDDFTHEDEDLHIGGGGDSGTSFRWSGLIDDVGLFRTSLDAQEIQSIMTSGVTSINNNVTFSIETITRSENGPLIITWNSNPGITYAIDRAIGGFKTDDWEELDDSSLATDTVTSYTDDDIPDGAEAVFYRVRLTE
ncbi:MAG: LamG-like jellyroll fold domain-containing protein, partial [Verrucomicrobiota bacterium]|nr:LamG-like jellyroll fold domain-containing protein [Verrucomicrobiota bacterium]